MFGMESAELGALLESLRAALGAHFPATGALTVTGDKSGDSGYDKLVLTVEVYTADLRAR